MSRVYNFSAGPSMLPESVLKRAADEMLDYEGSGQSVMEMSHRSKTYQAIIDETEALLREIMGIPENYKVLFLQGGASSQFAMIPLNLMNGSGKADFVITGQWANKAYQEASRYGEANVVASSKDKTFSYIPKLDPSTFTKDADYFHICMNNTIYGTKYHTLPDTGSVPLVADISSCILSEPIDVSRFGMLYAGAQKNVAPAGLTIVIVREDLIGHARDITPNIVSPVSGQPLGVVLGDIFSIHQNGTGSRCVHSAEQIQHSGFTGSAGADNDDELALVNFKIDTVGSTNLHFAHTINFGYILQFYISVHQASPFLMLLPSLTKGKHG